MFVKKVNLRNDMGWRSFALFYMMMAPWNFLMARVAGE